MKNLFFFLFLIGSVLSPAQNEVRPSNEKTYFDLQKFILSDNTNEIGLDSWGCVDFSENLMKNARNNGFQVSGFVVTWIDYPDSHEFVAFNTMDKGIIMIEPQNDLQYEIKDGELCDSSGYCWESDKLDRLYFTYNQDFQDMHLIEDFSLFHQ